jgi:hypothetical protein
MDRETILKFKSYSLRAIGEHYGFRFDKVGDKWRALCLFHRDTSTPNLFVYPDDSFFCFACKRGGPKSAFIAAAEHVNRSLIEKMWGNTDPLEDVVAMNLTPRSVNFKPQLQLFIAKFYYTRRQLIPGLNLDLLKHYDELLSRSKTLSMEEYAAIVKDISDRFGGTNGNINDAGSVHEESGRA